MESSAIEPTLDGAAVAFGFGPFQYDPIRRELRDASGPVRMGRRALKLLEVLLENPGRLYSREELVARVWQRTVVEETSLRVHVSALNRVLGDGPGGKKYVANVPGRGYAFVGDVKASMPVDELPRLPARLIRPVGRGADIAAVAGLLSLERLVTIVGAGGMGKTTVALAVAESLHGLHGQGAFFVDLSTLADAALVVAEVAQSCGLKLARGEPWAVLEDALRDRQVLIVLDNCEHVIVAASTLADRLLRSCPKVRILATSREPLEAEVECVFRLAPLGQPEPGTPLALEAVLAYPAVQLFVDRARAACHSFELSDDNVQAVRQLCEFLDGNPLAIELAAARMNSLGAQGLLLKLDSAFELLTRGRRTAMSRHQTLHALLSWSYELLTETERQVLRRLSVFRSSFGLDGAIAVAACPQLPSDLVAQCLLGLCEKSMVAREADGGSAAGHRLLYVTRLFAQRMLAASPDAAQTHRRHAVHVRDCMTKANVVRDVGPGFTKGLGLASTIAETRAAVGWALLEENDLALGLDIVAESNRTWHVAGLMDEFARHLITAVDKARSAGVEMTRLGPKLQMIQTFLSAQAPSGTESHRRGAVVDRALVDQFDDTADKIEALFALCASAYGRGDFVAVVRCCDELRQLAQGEFEGLSVALGDRFSACALHELGQHDAAERLAYRVMACDGNALAFRFQSPLPFTLSMSIRLARIHWLRGEFQDAWAIAQAIAAQDDDAHTYAKCQPLGLAAIPIAIWKGDLQAARRWTQALLHHSEVGNVPYWQAFAKVYGHVLDARPLRPGSPKAEMLASNTPLMDIHGTLQPLSPHPATLHRVRHGEVGWCAPEVLRLAALDLREETGPGRCMAELREAFSLSVAQGARFWSLRIAISLVETLPVQSLERPPWMAQLRTLLRAIDDGSTQPDLQRARALV